MAQKMMVKRAERLRAQVEEEESNNTDRVIEAIRKNPGLDDDQLAKVSDVHPRNQVNQICLKLERGGKVRREQRLHGKIVNYLVD